VNQLAEMSTPEAAANVAAFFLRHHENGQHALAYLIDRGFSDRWLGYFQFGFWDASVSEILLEAGHTELEDYDLGNRLLNRIVLPLRLPDGTVQGMVGRKLPSDPHPVKYLYPDKAHLVDQRTHLFGVDSYLTSGQQWRWHCPILLEGPWDSAYLQQERFPAVSSHGARLTLEQALTLRALDSRNLVVVPDGDVGFKNISSFLQRHRRDLPQDVRIAQLPPGEDPGSVLKEMGPQVLREYLEAAQILYV
jgi:DNA primase